jgi:hypothetical protein
MGSRLGYPNQITDMQRYLDDFEARGITDRTAEIMDYAKENNNMIDGVTIFEEGDPRKIFQDAILNPEAKREYKPVYGGIDGIPVELGPERSFFKPDEIDISTPFRPEGVEGEDFYQDVTGNYFAWHDDLGTEPLKPAETIFSDGPNVRGSRRNPTLYSDGPNVRGTRGDTIPADIPDFLDYDITRMNEKKAIEEAVNARDSQLQEQLDSRPLYEREGNQEFTSNSMNMLSDSMDAIDAKYEGSKTDASAEAELKEILNATLAAFGSDAGRENAALAREQQDMRQANATSYIPEYAREDEGTDTGELAPRDLVRPSLVYTGSGRATGGEAREGQKSGRGPGLATSIHNQAILDSIFKEPEPIISSSPSLFIPQQIKPNVAETKNNMTVPKINWGGSGYGNNPGPWRW